MPLFKKPEKSTVSAIYLQDDSYEAVQVDDQFEISVGASMDLKSIVENKSFLLLCQVLDSTRTYETDNIGTLDKSIVVRRQSIDEQKSGIPLFRPLIQNFHVDLTQFIDNSETYSKKINGLLYRKVDGVLSEKIESLDGILEEKVQYYVKGLVEKKSAFLYDTDPSYVDSTKVPFIIKFRLTRDVVYQYEKAWVYVDLLSSSKSVIQTVYTTISLVRVREMARASSVAPNVLPETDRGRLVLRNRDRNEVSFVLQGKNGVNTKIKLPPNKSSFFIKNSNLTSIKVFHESEDKKSYTYSSFSIPNTRNDAPPSVGEISAIQTKEGVILTAFNVHTDSVSNVFYCVDETTRSAPVVVEKRNQTTGFHAKPFTGRIYKYYFVSTLKNGLTVTSSPDYVEILPTYQEVYVTINNTSVQDSDVTFEIAASIKQASTETLYNLFKSRGLDFVDQYVSGLQDITKFVSFIVYRTDMTAGGKDYMGILTENTFSDRRQSSLYGSSFLVPGRKYQYQVFVVLTDPTTVFDSQKFELKTRNGNVTADKQKFLHPASIKNSTLFTPLGLKRFPKSMLEFGALAPSVSITIDTTSQQDFSVNNLRGYVSGVVDKKKVTIMWSSSTSQLEEYYIVRSTIKGSIIVGRVAPSSELFFVDTAPERGLIAYSVIPVIERTANKIGQPSMTMIEVNP